MYFIVGGFIIARGKIVICHDMMGSRKANMRKSYSGDGIFMKIKGFSFSAVEAGIRYSNRLDLGLIYCDVPCVTAGVFTTSQVKAAPVILDKDRLKSGHAQAILVNSGCANACTGTKGMEVARATSGLVSQALGIADDLVQVSSTGVIGEQLPLEPFRQSIPKLVEELSPDNFDQGCPGDNDHRYRPENFRNQADNWRQGGQNYGYGQRGRDDNAQYGHHAGLYYYRRQD